MSFFDDCEKYFNTKKLYDVLGVSEDASEEEIRKKFRRLSLSHHPDRFPDSDGDQLKEITAKFQTLSKIYYILSDPEKRNIYDETGSVADDELFESGKDWMDYWRCLFPEVTTKDIEQFMDNYFGSEKEKEDLIRLYNKYEGDLNLISEHMIGYDEDKTRGMINQLIESKEVEAFDKFVNESQASIQKRKKRALKEAKEAEKAMKKLKKTGKDDGDSPELDLVQAIQSRSRGNFDSVIDSIAAKYATNDKKTRRKGRK